MLRHRGARGIVIVAALAAAFVAADEFPSPHPVGLDEGKPWGVPSPVLPANRDELLAYRRDKVRDIAFLRLYPPDYEPSAAVFGHVADGKHWTKSSGFYVGNPQLLLIASNHGRISPITYWAAHGNRDGEQQFFHGDHRLTVVYRDVSANHWMHWVFGGENYPGKIALNAPNARDAGFHYGMLDTEKSENIDPDQSGDITRRPVAFKSFFHYGNNVSANNLSPKDDNVVVALQSHEKMTRLYVKLWRDNPATTTAPADYIHVIQVHPNPAAADYGVTGKDDTMLFALEWLSLSSEFLLPLILLLMGFFIGRYKEHRHYQSIRRREQALLNIPVITSTAWDGERDVEYARFVSGSTVVSVDYFKRFLAFFRNLVGGEVSAYSPLLDRAKREAILRMKESARDADAFLHCRLQTYTIAGVTGAATSVEVVAYATALRYRR